MASGLPRLGSDFEIWGHWWLPEHSEDQVSGCLSCRGGNLQLKLLGQFDAIDPNKLFAKVPVIHGVGDTKTFTLWNAVQDRFGFRSPGTIEQHFVGMRILSGSLLSDRSQVRFSGTSMHSANIGPWSNLRVVDCAFSAEDPTDISYRLAAVKSTEISLDEHGLAIKLGNSWSTRNEEFKSYGFDVSPFIRIGFQSPKLFEEMIECAGSLQRLLSLLIGVEFITDEASAEIDGVSKRESLLGLLFEYMPHEDEKPLSVHEVLIPFHQIQDRAAGIFSSWFREEPRIKDAVDLFLGTIRRRPLPTPAELTSLAQSLETFHRNVHGGNYMFVEDYEPVRKRLSEAIPEELDSSHRDALKNRIKYGYQISFRKRLVQLVKGFDSKLLASLGIDARTFPETVANARNDFTHWDAEAGIARLRGADLSNLVSKVKAFTRLVLLAYLGVPPELIVRRTLDNKHLYLEESINIEWT